MKDNYPIRKAHEILGKLHLVTDYNRIDKVKEEEIRKKFKEDKAIECKNQWEVRKIGLENITLDGLILEFGVFKGASIRFIAENIGDRRVHGFDSFEGFGEMPKGRWSSYKKDNVFDLKNTLPIVSDNVILHKGYFDKTLPRFLKQNSEKVSFIHVDCDIYSSTKTIFQFLAERIVPGTIIVFDEYHNYPGMQFHEYLAFQECVKKHNVKYTFLGFGTNAPSYGHYGKVALRIDEIDKMGN